MEKIFHLSHLLDTDGYNRIDLISFYELSRLDKYIENFSSNKEIRKKYDMDISEFCLHNMKKIQRDNKIHKRNWTGSIAIICEIRDDDDKTVSLHKIPIIYKNDYKLLSKKDCLRKIKDRLENSEVILDIFNNKRYLLSPNEIELIYLYFKWNNKKYLKSANTFFYNRLRSLDDDELLYYYCRALMHTFGLNELSVKTKFGTISKINDNIPMETTIIKKSGYSEDEYFNSLIDDENYDELYNIYPADIIERNSNIFVIEKGKKK